MSKHCHACTLVALPITAALVLVGGVHAAPVQVETKVARPVPAVSDGKTPAPAPILDPVSRRSRLPSQPAARVTAAAASQQVTKSEARSATWSAHVPPDRVHVSEPGDGSVWVRGKTYKAGFAAEGTTYIPYFGSRAETNHPVRFVLTSARVGDEQIPTADGANPSRGDDDVQFARGALVERWRWSADAVEQEFVFDELPRTGDLVIDVAVDTDLAPDARPTDTGALRFGNALGHVEYGAPLAIDADGHRYPMSSTWRNGSIELRLDRAALASATFPLVVDPLVSTFAVDASFTDDFGADTAYEAGTDSYLVVEETAYSATDHDVYATRLDAAGNVLYSNYLDVTSADWRRPRVASNALAQNFLCVASATPIGGGQSAIRGVTFAAPTNTIGAQFTISGGEAGNKLNPDVGGDPALVGPTYYFVIWQRRYSATDQDIHARRVGADGSVSPTIFVDNSSNTIDTFPAISKSDGHPPFGTQNWTIVWQRDDSGFREQVWAAQYLWDGSLTHATYSIDSGDDCLRPTVSSLLDGDGVSRPYMVAYQVRGQGQTQWDILGTVFVGTQFLVGTDVGNQVGLTLGNDQIQPCVDSDGQHFSVTWAELYPSSLGDWDIFVADLVYAAGYPYVCQWDTFAYTSLQELAPRLTSTYSGGGARRRYLAAWDVIDQYTTGATHDVFGGLWDGCEGGFAKAYCFGDGNGAACPCSNYGSPGNGCASSVNAAGANLGYVGNPWIGNDSFTLVGTGMPNSTALYFVGTGPLGQFSGVPFGDGLRCVGGTVFRIGTKLNSGGTSQYPEAGDPPLSSIVILPSSGSVLYYQVWYRNGAAFCTASTFNLTNGLYAVWAQ